MGGIYVLLSSREEVLVPVISGAIHSVIPRSAATRDLFPCLAIV